jgi:hypothetical protein
MSKSLRFILVTEAQQGLIQELLELAFANDMGDGDYMWDESRQQLAERTRAAVQDAKGLKPAMEKAIREAEQAERERCAKIAEQDKWNSGAVVRQQIAAEIREQGAGK